MRVIRLLTVMTCLSLGPFVRPCLAEDLTGTLKKIKDTGTVSLGTRESSKPFSYLDQTNQTVGFSVDVCRKVVDKIKVVTGSPGLKIKYLTAAPSARIPLLANGTIDMECSTTSMSLSRMRQIGFSSPFFAVGARILTKTSAGIKDWEDLKGKVIGVPQGTNSEKEVKSLVETPPFQGTQVITFPDHAAGVLAVETDRIDGYVTDDVVLAALRSDARSKDQLTVTGRPLTFETYAIVIRRDDPDFKLVVDTALSELYRSGEIRDIYQKWFAPLELPMSEANSYVYKIGGIVP